MTADTAVTVAALSAEEVEARLPELTALLLACVEAGASINFVMPFTEYDSEAFWRAKVLPPSYQGSRTVLVALSGGNIVGSVQLSCDTPPNQPHRAEVTKLMVHPGHRRRGIARLLMAELERRAAELGRSLITLDTRTGDSAEPLYASLGYKTVGIVPGYSRDVFEDRLDSTTIMYKNL